MKICTECYELVDSPRKTTYGAYYGAYDPTHIELLVWECPRCGGEDLEDYCESEQLRYDDQLYMYDKDPKLMWSDLREYCPSDWSDEEMLSALKDMVCEMLDIRGYVV